MQVTEENATKVTTGEERIWQDSFEVISGLGIPCIQLLCCGAENLHCHCGLRPLQRTASSDHAVA